MASLTRLGILLQLALRNLAASKINWIIGAVIFAGTLLVLVGSALLDSLDRSMASSIRGSVAGDLQVYSAKSKDELALFGAMGGDPDLTPITDFGRLEDVLGKVPNVRLVVPMGIAGAIVTGGNAVDLALAELRGLVRQQQQTPDPERARKLESTKAHVQQIVRVLARDLARVEIVQRPSAESEESRRVLAQASSPELWASFERDPDAVLELLENKVAPELPDGDFIYLRYIGTDLDAFEQAFDRVRIVDGTPVPKGRRGFLFNKFIYEERVKLRTARRLDKIKEARDAGQLIADNATLQRYVKENRTQPRDVVLQLDPIETAQAIALLQKALGSSDTGLTELLGQLFDTNDANFDERYRLFYQELAPMLAMYSVPIGDTLTIKAFTRSGFVQSVNVKVYGTFEFKGLEKSALSGGMSLMDLVSFRELYGFLSSDKLAEIESIKRAAGAKEVSREDAEAALFGGAESVEARATPGVIDEGARLGGLSERLRRDELVERVFPADAIRKGLVLNAAVLLHDPKKLKESLSEVQKAADAAGLKLKVVSWQEAAGLIGQFVLVAKLALYFAVLVIFLVLLVIINNAVMMATMQRVREIGTMRAIGAQRPFVLVLILFETVFLGVVFGGAGALVGSGLMAWLQRAGIPASSEELYFFFAGPRLYPTMSAGNLLWALGIVLLVSAISTLYPAFLAARVSPLRAMQTED